MTQDEQSVTSEVSRIDALSSPHGMSLRSDPSLTTKIRSSSSLNKVSDADRPFHDWYRFVLSFPPHLVREYLQKFAVQPSGVVLDPFCGTGTTIVEAQLNGFSAIGLEANPVAHFASSVKTTWDVNPALLRDEALRIARLADKNAKKKGALRTLDEDTHRLLLKDSICDLPLHRALVLRDSIKAAIPEAREHLMLAFAKTLVFSASNLHFGPEVGVRGRKEDAEVVAPWLLNVNKMSADLDGVSSGAKEARVIKTDARAMSGVLQRESIDVVFTSPPYPNEKDYTRTTRLESVLLEFVKTKDDLRVLKKGLVRSNTRGVYKSDEDDIWVAGNARVNAIADEIERRRIALGKTSGFEKLYGKVTKLYFGGMARHLAELRPFLKPGAKLGYVVGDQASYLQVMIRTGEILAEIAKDLGYEVESIDLFRTRISTVTKAYMREEVVVLRWPRQSTKKK